jgi:hypothetical protein
MLRFTIWLAGQSQLRNESAAFSISDEQSPPERTRRSCLPGSLPPEPGEGSPEKVGRMHAHTCSSLSCCVGSEDLIQAYYTKNVSFLVSAEVLANHGGQNETEPLSPLP